MARRRYTPRLKAQVVLEVLGGEKTRGQVAKAYGVHPNSVQLWRRRFVDRAPEVFARETTVKEYERRTRRQIRRIIPKPYMPGNSRHTLAPPRGRGRRATPRRAVHRQACPLGDAKARAASGLRYA